MKTRDIEQLDEKDEEIVDILNSLGMSRNAARALRYLQNKNVAKSVDFERVARLRQPEVSLVIKELNEGDWINERKEKKPGKGRPYKIYSLKVGFNAIIDQLENKHRKSVDKVQAKIERLKELRK